MSSRKTQKEIQEGIIKELDQGRNLVDYFIVIGPKPEIVNEPWLYQSTLSELNEEYLPQLLPVILSKFPPIEKKITGIDDTFVQHCFPNGYKVEEYDKCPPPLIFSILLDNNNFSSVYPFKYVTCLKFYESISNYKKIKDRYAKSNKDDNTFDGKSILSRSELTQMSRDFNQERPINTARTTVNGLTPHFPYRKYYLPKCICLVSLYPFFSEFSKIIKTIYNYSTVLKQPMPIEKIIENLTIEVPAPPRGIFSVEYNLLNEKLILKQNCMNELPTLSVEFDKMFTVFELEQILEIFKNVMLNSRIVFFSSNICLLTPIVLSSISLVYPFTYPFNVVSILPRDAYSLIDNISSVIVGINETYYDNFFEKNGIDISDMILVVDVDRKKLKTLYAKDYAPLPDLPSRPKEKLLKNINKYINEVHKRAKENSKETVKSFEQSIREIFLNFQIKIMKNYYKFLNSEIYSHQNFQNPLQNAFKEKEFLNSVNENDRGFYTKFIETQMFCDFIYKRMTPREKREKLDILFFEEKMFLKNKNNNGNINTVFLSSHEYEIKKKYTAQRPKNLSQQENIYFSDLNNRNNLITQGVIVTSPPGKNDSNLFTYYIFPKIQSEYFFETNLRNYFIIENLNEELANINSDLIAKSHLNSIEIKSCEMENYIYLAWLKLWAFTFYYHDIYERKYRFNQMLNVLDLVIHHEMDVFNNLFQIFSINKVEDEFIFKLYEKVIYYRLNPSIYIFDVIKHLIDKKGNTNKHFSFKHLSNQKKTQFEENDIRTKRNFRKRTLKNKYDSFITKEKIKFYMNDNCIECKEKITLSMIMKKINESSKEILWAKCPFCKTPFLPQITIRFGNEMNKNGELIVTTSVQDEIVLYSPFTLYYTMLNSIIKDNKIDVDNLKKNFNPVYWNLIWYFQMKNLPIDFFLPYEENINIFSNLLNYRKKNENFEISFVKQISVPELKFHFPSSPHKKKPKTKFNESSLSIINEICFDLNITSEMLYDGVVNTINSYVTTEENYVNPKNLMENSTIYFDTVSKMTETEPSEMNEVYRQKTMTVPLREIKEDQNENNINTPFKPKMEIPKITIDFDDSKEIVNFNIHTTSKLLSPCNRQCIFETSYSRSNKPQKSCKSLKPFNLNLSYENKSKESSSEHKNDSLIHDDKLLFKRNSFNEGHSQDRNETPTKGDYSIDFNVVKDFRRTFSVYQKNLEPKNPLGYRFNTESSDNETEKNQNNAKYSKKLSLHRLSFCNDASLHKASYDKNDI